MRGKFAGLGFDPAPGNADDVRAAADAMAGAGDRLAGSPGSMRAVLATGDWQGTSAEGFAAAGAPVPGALETAHGELRAASQALHTWHSRLLVNQHAAERLDKTARQLRTELGEAERDVLAADTRLAATTGPGRSQAEAALHDAQHHLTTLRTRLATTLRAAHRLAQRHRREADTAAGALRGTPPSTSWPAAAVAGIATGAGGTSAWTGQVASITLPGETDPVVALPLGAQPGDPGWPVLPTDPAAGGLDPVQLPDDLTGASSASVEPLVPIPPGDGPPRDPTSTPPGATPGTQPAAAVLAPPVPEPVAALAGRHPIGGRSAAADVARVVTTPAHAVRAAVQDAAPSTSVHREPVTTHRHATVARTYEVARRSEPVHHVASVEPTPARAPAHRGAHHDDQAAPQRHDGDQNPAKPHPPQVPAASVATSVTPSVAPSVANGPGHHLEPLPSGTTTAETAATAPPANAAPAGPSAPTPAVPAPGVPVPGGQHMPSSQPPSPQVSHQPAPEHLATAPGQQAGAVADQGKASSQPGTQQTHDHRKDPDPLPSLATDPAPGDYTGVVLPAPPQWDGTSVAPLREAGLLPGTDDGLWATFVIAAALGPALIAESLASGRQRARCGKKRQRNRMRAFLLQPGGENLVLLTLQARSAEGWTTQRALFLRAVAQYRRADTGV